MATAMAEAQVSLDRFWSSTGDDPRLCPPGRYLVPGGQADEGGRPCWLSVAEAGQGAVGRAISTSA
jgi:hypothetical protein